MRPRPFPRQGDVTQGRVAIAFIAIGDVGYLPQRFALFRHGFRPQAPVTAAGHPLALVQAHQLGAGDPIEHTPYLIARSGTDVGRRGFPPGSASQVEPKPVTGHFPRPPVQGPHSAPFPESAVVHVRPKCEIPNQIFRVPAQPDAVAQVAQAGDEPSPTIHGVSPDGWDNRRRRAAM